MKWVTNYQSPIGLLELTGTETHLCRITFVDKTSPAVDRIPEILTETQQQLAAFFDGRLKNFDIPCEMGGTQFQQAVWLELTRIPYGETRTYGQIAAAIQRPKAARAVGMANNRNPIPIIIPCHRVIGADGRMIGYAGGVGRKEWLLQHEHKFA